MMMTKPARPYRSSRRSIRRLCSATIFAAVILAGSNFSLFAQDAPSQQAPGSPQANPPVNPQDGPATDNGSIILKKKKDADETAGSRGPG